MFTSTLLRSYCQFIPRLIIPKTVVGRTGGSNVMTNNYSHCTNCMREIRRRYCTPAKSTSPGGGADPPVKESMFQKLKGIAKDYWYVVIPVHTGTSIVWGLGFYQIAKRYEDGLDIPTIMKYVGINESITEKIVSSGAGNLAVTYALYKVATPARYTVTLGCSMYAINYLKKRGFITAKELGKQARDLRDKQRDKYLNLKKPSSSSSKSSSQDVGRGRDKTP